MKYKNLRNKKAYLLIALLALIVGFAFFLTQENREDKSIYNRYVSSQKPLAKSIIDDLSPMIDSIGVNGVVELLERGEGEKRINSSECHGIMHLLGHQIYSRGTNLSRYIQKYANKCEAGVLHGIEAQITLEEQDESTRNKRLREVCSIFTSSFPNVACFHGVGHVYYQMHHDVKKALNACDSLESDDVDLNPCYRGVFNELANAMIGIDGETGLPMPAGSKRVEKPSDPLSYCNRFAEKYRIHCYSSILRLSNIAIPVPGFVSILPSKQQKIIDPRLPKVSEEVAKEHERISRESAVESDSLDLANCKPVVPLVMKVKKGEKILVKNSSERIRTIMLNKDTSYAVKPHSSIFLDDILGHGLYGYGCDYTPYAVGYFLIE